MSKFGWILGESLQETVRFSKACDAIAGKICHIRWTLEPASQSVVEALNWGIGPTFRPSPRFAWRFRRHFDPVYEFMT